MLSHTAKQIYHSVLDAQRVLVVPHQKPDGDAMGAATAMVDWLTNLGKPHTLFCKTNASVHFDYLPHFAQLHESESIWHKDPFDLIIVLDSGDLRYAGIADLVDTLPKRPKIINIDHHPTNEFYGDLNMVSIDTSSTCELLYRFFQHNGITVTKNMATSLLTGIITDTDNFTNAATKDRTMSVAGELLSIGGRYNVIKERVYKQTPMNAFGLWATILSRLSAHKELDLVYTFITQDDLRANGMREDDETGMTNFLNNVEEGKAKLILKERADGTIKGSFRTTSDDIDVGAIAKHLGGGGHQKAAGFTVEGPIEKALETVFAAAKKIQGPQLAFARAS